MFLCYWRADRFVAGGQQGSSTKRTRDINIIIIKILLSTRFLDASEGTTYVNGLSPRASHIDCWLFFSVDLGGAARADTVNGQILIFRPVLRALTARYLHSLPLYTSFYNSIYRVIHQTWSTQNFP